ncbi:AMP-binding protein [Nocardioides sp. CFH 31398]|uniref:AMP-binding protein n=1 Tax=Nocardioides sp. CFH 31398 TaxID=2919579 RepID=UPI001F06F4B6|nr:AMP-binding protein [Nocardioides sp. CFH 31398]MCH1868706.1 AMP-binding protein [Nocardioides sp. CFH 31398]
MTLSPLRPETGVPLARALHGFGDRVALRTSEGVVSYDELARLVDRAGERLGPERRLVLLAVGNDLGSVVQYLACLAGGHPVLLTDPAGDDRELVATYDPDVVVRDGEARQRRPGTAHRLHPDLALLLSTSGSTGSPRLVRLSAENVQANAESIATYLDLQPRDVAVTSLPLHYCYGLSVLHSHLLRGASVVLTSLSVVDRCFWDLCRMHRVTSLAGVPHTFELLDRLGFGRGGEGAVTALPSLRLLTQAGGKLAAEKVRALAELGQRRGFDLVVMYGQTEATARMAYLPSELAATAPHAVGRAVPGGTLRIEPAGAEVGELVYAGPNVMLGYADSPADLARGRVVTELRTGDLARFTDDGLVEVVGRASRSVKVLGLRVDLDRLEHLCADAGLEAWCAAEGDRVVVAVTGGPGAAERVRALLARRTEVPAGALDVHAVDALPRLPSGKPDHRAVAALAAATAAQEPAPEGAGTATADLVALYAELLDRDDVTADDSFVSLGGDSLSYVEVSLRLEERLGHLPADWHTTPLRRLSPAVRRRRGASVETGLVLRAVAIVAVVGTHGNLFVLTGGAHLLLGLAGFNLARFQLAGSSRRERVRRVLASLSRVVVPTVLWVGGFALLASAYPWQTALLLNGLLGPEEWAEPAWHLWFLEALVVLVAGVAALVTLPAVHRLERRWPFWLPFALAVVALLTRYDVVSLRGGDEIHRAHVVAWLFLAGWAASRARTTGHRAVLTALVCAATPGFLDDPAREAVVGVGMLLLVWVPRVRIPRAASRVVGLLAAASLHVYLVHWQVYPHFEDDRPLLGVVLSLAAGVAVWAAVQRVVPLARRGADAVASRRRAAQAPGAGVLVVATTSSPRTSTGTDPGRTVTVTGVPSA